MKHFKFLAPVAIGISMTAFLFSCNNGEEKKADEPVADTTTAKTVEQPPAPAEPAKPAKANNLMTVMAKVENFAKWLPDFESHDSIRNAYGLHKFSVGRGVKDTNIVLVVMTMDDVAKAKEFAASPDLKARMKKGGVIGAPNISFLDMQMMDKTPSTSTRVLIKHNVKDWDAWKKVFDADKPNREAAGLTDRALGYDVGDNHSVSLVLLVSDMKKAEEFSKSHELQRKKDKATVEGAPILFYYTQAKRY